MKGFIYFFIILIIGTVYIAFPQDIYITNISDENYPEIKIDFKVVDNNDNLINLNKEDLKLKESSIPQEIISISNPTISEKNKSSVVLSICIANSMNMPARILSKYTASKWVQILDTNYFETAIQTYNYYNYINQDFTKNKQKLFNALDFDFYQGGKTIDAALIDKPAGALNLTIEAQYQSTIILFTDGTDLGGFSNIINEAQKQGVKIYVIAFGNGLNAKIKFMVNKTNGLYFENIITEKQADKICRLITLDIAGLPSSSLTYISENCDFYKEIEIEIKGKKNILDRRVLVIDEKKLKHIEYPINNTVDFGIINKGIIATEQIYIKAVNDTLKIENIFSSNDNFMIDVSYPIIVPKDSILTLDIKYTSRGLGYDFSEFFIHSNLCFGMYFYVRSGSTEYIPPENTLKLVKPNGFERFFVGADTLITWQGVTKNDEVVLSYSTDAGQSWILIDDEAKNNQYKWQNIPIPPSKNCLMKVAQFTKHKNESKIIKIDAHKNRINSIVWYNKNKRILTAGDDGKIALWDIQTGERIHNSPSNINNLQAVSGFGNDSLAIYCNTSPFIKIFGINKYDIIDSLSADNENVICLSANSSEGTILAGTENGTIHLWDINTKTKLQTVSGGNDNIDYLIFSNNGKRFASVAGSQIKLWYSNGGSPINLPKFQYSINNVSFSNNDNYLAISTKDEVAIWSIYESKIHRKINMKDKIALSSVFALDTFLFAVADNENKIKIYDTKEEKFLYDFHTASVNHISWQMINGLHYLATADLKGFLHIWTLEDIPFHNIALQEDVSDNLWKITEKKLELKDINFGKRFINSKSDTVCMTFILNKSILEVKIDSIKIIGQDKDFFYVDLLSNILISPDRDINLPITFFPTEIRKYQAQIKIYSNRNIFYSNLSGDGVQVDLLVKPTSLFFGIHHINTITNKNIQLTNKSNKNININNIKLVSGAISNYSIPNNSEFILPANDSTEINIEFLPKQKDRLDAILSFNYTTSTNPEYIRLYGEGKDEAIKIVDTLKFKNNICDILPLIDSILIENISQNDIEINDIQLLNDDDSDFSIIDYDLPIIIKKDAFYFIKIKFEAKKSGNKEAIAYIKIISKQDTIYHSVYVFADYQYYQLSFEPTLLEYKTNINTPLSKKTKIFNKGSISYTLDFPIDYTFFKVSIGLTGGYILNPGNSIEIDVLFKGYSKDTLIIDEIILLDECDEKYICELIAMVGQEKRTAFAEKEYSFDLVKCEQSSKDSTVIIKNTGVGEIIISDISILGDNFEIVNIDKKQIAMNDSALIKIAFIPKKEGENIQDTLVIKTNAENYQNGRIDVILLGDYIKTDFSLSINNINFIVGENKELAKEFYIYNLSNISNNISFSKLINYEIIVNDIIIEAELIAVPANDSILVKINFLGGDYGKEHIEELLISDSCEKTEIIELRTEIKKEYNAIIQAPQIEAEIGDTIKIKILLYPPDKKTLANSAGYISTFSYDNTILKCIDNQYLPTKNGNVSSINIQLLEFPDKDSIAITIPFIITFGESDRSDLLISNSFAINKIIMRIKEINGYLIVTNYNSLLETIELWQNSPNPTRDKTIIKYRLTGQGAYSLKLYNYLGQLAKVLVYDFGELGEYEYILNTKPYAQGVYYYVLETPNKSKVRKMIIRR